MSKSPDGIKAAATAEVGVAFSLVVIVALEHCDDARGVLVRDVELNLDGR